MEALGRRGSTLGKGRKLETLAGPTLNGPRRSQRNSLEFWFAIEEGD